MNGFCLKQGQSLKALAAHLHPNSPQVTPPPPPPGIYCTASDLKLNYNSVFVWILLALKSGCSCVFTLALTVRAFFKFWLATCNLQPATCDLRPATCNLQIDPDASVRCKVRFDCFCFVSSEHHSLGFVCILSQIPSVCFGCVGFQPSMESTFSLKLETCLP